MDITDAKRRGYEARLVAKGNRGSFWQVYLAGQPIDDQEFGTETDAWTHAINLINAGEYNH
ncbi:hypothetical protein [Pseudomonas sp. AO-1]|uniref:hypothetical protein n=1 Tax=unclassified Pseudomonas TaxID=196821 RepID=UPI001C763235|nr:hypothetical protein [Pseudomonas sp. AO-1]QXZ13457.1 hypothetical protein KVQ82_25785 [Pseudomonas sp. AO-1]